MNLCLCVVIFDNITYTQNLTINKSSRSQIFFKKALLENFASFTGKHLSWSLFGVSPNGLQLYKKMLQHRCFSVEFTKFLRTPFYIEDLWWLPLNFTMPLNLIHFMSLVSLYPLKTLKNLWLSGVFRGYIERSNKSKLVKPIFLGSS